MSNTTERVADTIMRIRALEVRERITPKLVQRYHRVEHAEQLSVQEIIAAVRVAESADMLRNVGF